VARDGVLKTAPDADDGGAAAQRRVDGQQRCADHDIVNMHRRLGVRGAAVVRRLQDLAPDGRRVHFVSNLDGVQSRAREDAAAESTLFIVSSKSFSTVETLTNARTLMKWFDGRG